MQMAYYPGMESCFNQRGTWDNTTVWKRNLDSQKKKFCSHRGFNLLSKKTFLKAELGRKSRVSWSFVGRGHAEILQKVVGQSARVGRHQGHLGVSPGVAGDLDLCLERLDLTKQTRRSSRVVGCPATPPAAFSTHDTASCPEPYEYVWEVSERGGGGTRPPKNVKNQTVLAS